MYLKRHTLSITTDASGDGTGYTPVVNGRVLDVQYVETDYATTVDFTITGAITSKEILSLSGITASTTWLPRIQVHDSADGTGLLYNVGRKVCEPVCLANERVKITVAQGGNAKSGTFYVTIG